jgi:FtsP/CotA-like multicopper oxidase with cupredoxin domain
MPAHGDGHGQDTTRLGTTERYADTLGVNPGKRDDVIVSADRPGMWRFHCHILRHIEGIEGMFGMVNTPIVTPTKVDLTPLLT